MNDLKKICQLVRADILISTTEAGSGHPTSSLSPVELMVTLFFGSFLNTNDRVIFSKGHASPLLYALYYQKGIITDEQLLTMRKFGSPLEGHPTPKLPFVDVATGSLGQGLSAGLGMALAIKTTVSGGKKNNQGNSRQNLTQLSNVYVLLGDSEMAEGQVWEAVQLASYYKLNNLIAILDVNRLGQRGETMLGWKIEKYQERLKAFGWNTILIDDGHDLEKVKKAFEETKKYQQTTQSPTIIIAKTIKGKGVSFLENKDNWHGKPLSKEQLDAALSEIEATIGGAKKGLPIPLRQIKHDFVGQAALSGFTHRSFSEDGNEFDDRIYRCDNNNCVSTREAYGNALVKLGEKNKKIVVLDAEVSNSTYSEKFKEKFPDRFFEMFIAEQNMVSVALGLSKMGYIPFVSTFAAFLTRAFDQIRMSQYSDVSGGERERDPDSVQSDMKSDEPWREGNSRQNLTQVNLKIIGSHAGCHIGADGPSQMGLEDMAMMRSILKSMVFYPSDAVSTAKLVDIMAKTPGIFYLRTTREKTPIIYSDDEVFEIGGSKIHYLKNSKLQITNLPAGRQVNKKNSNDESQIKTIIIGAGITLHEALKAQQELIKEDINTVVVDCYSVKPIDKKTLTNLTQKTKKIIVVEDHYPDGGLGDAVRQVLINEKVELYHLAVTKIPGSATPSEQLSFEGIDSQAIVKKVQEII